MVCTHLTELLGIRCEPISDDGNVAMIATSFSFDDGEPMPVFVEKYDTGIRFFDDGEIIRHFMGRGLRFDDQRGLRFIRSACEPHHVTLNEAGEVEIYAEFQAAPSAFAAYLSALVAMTTWEREQRGPAIDATLFVEEVAIYLRNWQPEFAWARDPEYTGISGQTYRLDFGADGRAVVATGTHHASVNSALRKLLDIRSAPANDTLKLFVVLDDRSDPRAARRDTLLLERVADVIQFSALERNFGRPTAH